MSPAFSDLIIPGNVPKGIGRFLGSQTKMMYTAGYATNHIPLQSALAQRVKAADREVIEDLIISLLAGDKADICI
jgi:hypothetical protein